MHSRVFSFAISIHLMVAPMYVLAQTTSEARHGWDASIKELEQASVTSPLTSASMAIFAADVMFVEANGRVSSNRAELEKNIRHDLQAITVKSWSYETTDFGNSGPLAYGSGISTATFIEKSSGKEKKQKTRFLILMKQQPDKRWLIFREFWAPVKGETKGENRPHDY